MRLIFFLFFFSFNLNAANYLICESERNTLINIKLDNKKIYIQNYTEDFENYTPYIKKWTDELIKTEKQFKYIDNKYDTCLKINADLHYRLYGEASSKLKKICKDAENIDVEKEGVEVIKINRLNGLLIFDRGKPMYDWKNPRKFILKTNFDCRLQETNLF
jgi:hypothetical protein